MTTEFGPGYAHSAKTGTNPDTTNNYTPLVERIGFSGVADSSMIMRMYERQGVAHNVMMNEQVGSDEKLIHLLPAESRWLSFVEDDSKVRLSAKTSAIVSLCHLCGVDPDKATFEDIEWSISEAMRSIPGSYDPVPVPQR